MATDGGGSPWGPFWLRRRSIATAGLLLLAGCAAPPPPAPTAMAAGPPAPGLARIWFYWVFDPSLSRNAANVDLNGARAASVLPGGAPTFTDVAPGHYHLAPESFGRDSNQTRDIDLAAGQMVYVKILDDPEILSAGDTHEFRRDTFYTWLMPPAVAQAEMRM